MDFVMGLPLLIDRKGNNYDAILVVVDCLKKIMYYKLIKTIIDIVDLADIIINIVIRHYSLSESIINDQGSLFISKF